MKRSFTRLLVGTGVALLALPGLALPAAGTGMAGGEELWSVSVAGPAPASYYGTSFRGTAVGPDGTVYSVGSMAPRAGGNAMLTVAHSPAGARRWAATVQEGPGTVALGTALTVDAGAGRLYVTGGVGETTNDLDYLTVAYDVDDGTEVWRARYDGSAGSDFGEHVAVDPATGTVYVAGESANAEGRYDVVTAAYSGSGTPLWTNRHPGPVSDTYDYAAGLDLDAAGNLYLTTYSYVNGSEFSTTLSYAPDGRVRWNRVSPPGLPEANDLESNDLVVDAARGQVYVTGTRGGTFPPERLTQAYSLTGQRLWAVTSEGTAARDYTGSLAVDSDSGRLYLTAGIENGQGRDFMTTAFDPDGTIVWSRIEPSGGGSSQAITVDPSTDVVYVTGIGYVEFKAETVTVAYSADGDLLWRAARPAPGAYPRAIATDPANGQLYVVGGADSRRGTNDDRYATILAYAGR